MTGPLSSGLNVRPDSPMSDAYWLAVHDARVVELEGALDEMYRFTVVPRRSVDRIRRAIAEGRDAEDYLIDIENGLQACAELAVRMDTRPAACPECHGTGHRLPSKDAS